MAGIDKGGVPCAKIGAREIVRKSLARWRNRTAIKGQQTGTGNGKVSSIGNATLYLFQGGPIELEHRFSMAE